MKDNNTEYVDNSNLSENEKKANEYIEKAKSLEKYSYGKNAIRCFLSGGPDYYQIQELYKVAANFYKISKNWEKGGNALVHAAKIGIEKLNDQYGSGILYADAGFCYRSIDKLKAIEYYKTASSIFITSGNLSTAARHHASIGEIYDIDLNKKRESIEFYESASNLLASDNLEISSNKFQIRVAELKIELEEFRPASNIFEKIATSCLTRDSKISPLPYYLKAVMCDLCFDVQDGTTLISIFSDRDNDFKSTKEFAFLNSIADILDKRDVNAFDNLIKEYDRRLRFDQTSKFLISVLRKIVTGEFDDK